MLETRIPRERPILFSGPMVKALIDGSKTQTRRIIKPGRWLDLVEQVMEINGKWVWTTLEYDLTTPYGQPGDRLWVRETWVDTRRAGFDKPFHYRADLREPSEANDLRIAYGFKFKPSIHMPRIASRLTLEIVSVRVERLQDISEEDAFAEGIDTEGEAYNEAEHYTIAAGRIGKDPIPSVYAYRALWESINGPGSWEKNPFVWCVEFKRIPRTQEAG